MIVSLAELSIYYKHAWDRRNKRSYLADVILAAHISEHSAIYFLFSSDVNKVHPVIIQLIFSSQNYFHPKHVNAVISPFIASLFI